MDINLNDMMINWGLPQLIETLQENEIDEEIFLNLTESDIKELIPKLGVRKKFLLKHQEYVLLKKALDSPFLDEDGLGNSTTNSSISTDELEEADLPTVQFLPYKERSVVGWPYVLSPHENYVRKLIDTSEEGREIVASYGSGKQFLRSKLCTLLIKEELKDDKCKIITTSRFIQLADEINQVFLHERPEIYFVPYEKNVDGRPKAARGKLFSTYHYMRKNLKKLGLIPCSSKESDTSVIENIENEEELLENVQWLKNNVAPFSDVLQKWQQTTKLRLRNFPAAIHDYFETFPALKHPQGYTLLLQDFQNLYSDKNNLLFSTWPVIYPKILKIAESKKDSYLKQAIEDFKTQKQNDIHDDVFALSILPLLLPCVNLRIKRKSTENSFKPSKLEQKRAFLLHVKDIADLEPELQLRRESYRVHHLTEQPLAAIVGDFNNIIQASFIIINNIKYSVESPLKAVDTCFKLYHTLNAEYPKEVEVVWSFIQTYVYKLSTTYDKKFVSVNTLIADVERLDNN